MSTNKLTKLSAETLETLRTSITIAQMTNVDSLIIDENTIRGQALVDAIAIVTPTPCKVEFTVLGLNRLNLLHNRLNLIADNDKCEAFTEDDGNRILKLIFKTPKTKIEFRCADPAKIKAPSKVNDPSYYSFKVLDDTIQLLTRSNIAMDADKVTFTGSQGKVFIKVLDTSGDVLEHEVSDNLQFNPNCDKTEFEATYKTKKLIPLLKDCARNGGAEVNITRRNIFGVKVRNFNIFVIPEA